jgi:hypothetical protein
MRHPIFALADLAAMFMALTVLVSLVGRDVEAVPGNGILFGTDANGGNLITVDPVTGMGTVVGPMGAGVMPALAVDPTTGIMYAGRGAGVPDLYTVDSATGAATLIGSTGLGFAAIGGMEFNTDGTLYAAINIAGDGGTGSDHLAIIDETTGATTVIGPFGTCTGVTIPSTGSGSCTIEGIEAIAFDTAGTLRGALSTRGQAGAPGLYTIDPATGAATFVAPIVDASGLPPSGGIVSLQVACDGTLYGGTARAILPATDGGRLITIDSATGRFTFVGSVSATAGQSLGALAFQDPCPAVDVVTIRLALFVDQLALLVVVATSSAAPDVELFLTVPGCLTEAPMHRIGNRYNFLQDVHECGNLDGQTATVTSSRGGSASAPLR